MSGFSDSAGNLAHYHGHRDRLRGRFRDKGADSLADYELLELALFRALPRRDTKPIAKALLARFGTLADVLSAPPQRLKEIDGVGEQGPLPICCCSAPLPCAWARIRCASGRFYRHGIRFWTIAARPWPLKNANSSASCFWTRKTS